MSGRDAARLRPAEDAIRRDEPALARRLLAELVREDPDNHLAWLYLAGLAPTPQESLACVRRAERLRPGDPLVLRARAWAENRAAAAPPAREPAVPPPDPTQDELTRLRQKVAARPAPAAPAVSRSGGRWVALLAVLGLTLTLVLATSLLWLRGGASLPAAVAEVLPGRSAASATDPAANTLATVSLPAPTATPRPALPATRANVRVAFLQPKPAVGQSQRPRWTATPIPTNTPTPTATPLPTFIAEPGSEPVLRPAGLSTGEKWIDVDLSEQALVAYEGDQPVFDSLLSSGLPAHPTVIGQFRIWLRFTAQTMDGRRLGYNYYLEDVPFVQYFYQDYALHGTFWHNNFGRPMSHGCVNLPTPAAEWLYHWADYGTLVNVHA